MSKSPDKELLWDPTLHTAEEKAELVRELTRPSLLEIEVHWRTLKAAKANPGSLRITVTDAEGVTVIERPYRPRNIRYEAGADRTDFKRHMVRRIG